VYEVWRTALLISFANRVYSDADRRIFLVELDGSSVMRPIKEIRRIPDQAALDRLMEETCWARAGIALSLILGGIAWAYVPDFLHIPVMVAAAVVASICGRSSDLVMKECPEVPKNDFPTLTLTKEPELAHLKHLRVVVAGSLLLPVIGFVLPHLLKIKWSVDASVISMLASFCALIAAGYIILTVARLSNRVTRDLREPDIFDLR